MVCSAPTRWSTPGRSPSAYTREGNPSPSTGMLRNWCRSALNPGVAAFARLWLLAAWAFSVCAAPVIAT